MTTIEFASQITSLQGTLRSFTHKFTQDLEESHDLVQETLLKALVYKDHFQRNTNLKGWLFTIMRNTFINNYRKNQRSRTIHDTSNELYFLNVKDSHTFSCPESKYEYDDIVKHIKSIKEELLEPFEMYMQGFKYHEIAEQLELPLGTVKNRIFQARKEIQKKLNDNNYIS